MQDVSTKELQRTLAIRNLNGRISKGKGKGISDARKRRLGTSSLYLFGSGKRAWVNYEQSLIFLSPWRETRETEKWPY